MRDSQGMTAFMQACKSGLVPIVEILLSAGAQLSCTDDAGMTALHQCVANRHSEVLRRLLVEKNVAINAITACWRGEKMTALKMACRLKNVHVVEMLLTHAGLNINLSALDVEPLEQVNPLLAAVRNDDIMCISALLKHPNIDVNFTTTMGKTPAHGVIRH